MDCLPHEFHIDTIAHNVRLFRHDHLPMYSDLHRKLTFSFALTKLDFYVNYLLFRDIEYAIIVIKVKCSLKCHKRPFKQENWEGDIADDTAF